MKPATLIVLVGITAAVGVGAALVSMQGRATRKSEVATELVFPDLAANINSVETVRIQRPDNKTLTLKRSEAGWQIEDKGGYPAKVEKIKEVLLSLTQLKKVEQKTSKPENYAKIGVEDPANAKPPTGDAAPSSATLLTLQDGKGATIASVILGNTKWDSKPGIYLRKAGEAESWLADNRVDIPPALSGWVDAQIPGVPKDRIKRAELTLTDGSKTRISKQKKDDANFTVHDIPAGEELTSPNSGDTIAMALSGMSFEDVEPAAKVIPAPAGDTTIKPGPSAEFETFDGMKLLIQTAEKDGKLWAHMVATFEEVPPAPAPEAKPGETPPAPDKKPEEVQKEVIDFNAKTARWAFQIPDYKAGAFKTTVASMLKSKPPTPPPSLNQGNEAANLNPQPLPLSPANNPPLPPQNPVTPPDKPDNPPAQPAPTGG